MLLVRYAVSLRVLYQLSVNANYCLEGDTADIKSHKNKSEMQITRKRILLVFPSKNAFF